MFNICLKTFYVICNEDDFDWYIFIIIEKIIFLKSYFLKVIFILYLYILLVGREYCCEYISVVVSVFCGVWFDNWIRLLILYKVLCFFFIR